MPTVSLSKLMHALQDIQIDNCAVIQRDTVHNGKAFHGDGPGFIF